MFNQWYLETWVMIVQLVLSLLEIHQMVSMKFMGEYLINAQGEDVVAGTRTPQYITKKARKDAKAKEASMEESMPKVFKQLDKILKVLEKHYKDMQDVEFTVENNKFGCYKQDLEKELQNLQLNCCRYG